MNENLLDTTSEDRVPDVGAPELVGPTESTASPEGIPDKFWDSERGELRTEALVKSYGELERKLSSLPHRDIPESGDAYRIEVEHDLLTGDPEVNQRLHAAGFTNDQAQLVYDLAADKLAPLVTEVASVFEAENQVKQLVDHFGSTQRWQEAARQIATWGQANLPSEAYDALTKTSEGVLAMHRMMSNTEPSLFREGSTASHTPSEESLKQMMRDPRYWRDPDPSFVDRVREGFRRLYPD